MDNIVALVLAGGKGERLYPLTKDRAKPAVPFGGIYRIIDFTLSNAINSNLRKIYVLVQYKSYSLQRHIREGWNIFSRELGEFIDVVPAQMRIGGEWYLGTADSVFQNIYFLNQDRPEHVLILSGDHVYKMDYRLMMDAHREKKADVTIAVLEAPLEDAKRFGVLKVDADMTVTDFQEKPLSPDPSPQNPSKALVSMGIYIFQTETLIKRLFLDAKNLDSTHDFGKDLIPAMIGQKKVYAFPFTDANRKEMQYWRDIGTLDAYYEANMDLVNVDPILNLYDRNWPVRTYQEQLPPAKTVFASEDRAGIPFDSILSHGCIISGAKVTRSVLSPWVYLHSYAEVTDSILLNDVRVGRDVKIKRAIIDKGVSLPAGVRIGFDPAEDKKRFTITESGIVVIPKEYIW
ncbi:MAG: glucose-1-phosphate adenylyltransferase [Candidatus Ratteibacteria bacterium]|jgi:glucose-1-phosphate adenylyltransferase